MISLKYSYFSNVLLIVALCFGCLTGCSRTSEGTVSDEISTDDEVVTIELDVPKTNVKPRVETIDNNTQYSNPLSVSRKKNVILMIADGAGFGSFYCAADFETGSPTGVFYQQTPWKSTSVATFHKKSFYDPAQDWADFKNLRVPFFNKEPAFIPPDSASTGTAMMTGVKTRNGRVGIGPDDERLETIAEIFHRTGHAAGAVTTYQIASATMADAAAHEIERKHGQALFAQLLLDGNLDVLIGAGHPNFDDDGTLRAAPVFGKYGPSPEIWAKIQAKDLPDEWIFIEKRSDFQEFANASPEKTLPKKILGLIQTANSSQFHRREGAASLETSPSLSETALTAIQVLSRSKSEKKGFFLLVEGGAVDCANDANNLERCVEEMQDFNAAVAAVCRWVETYSSWDETLVIVTADHDNGAIYGPDCGSDGIPTSAPIYRGKGIFPDAKYYSDDHTKQLVPLYARGPGAEKINDFIAGTDERMGKFWNYDGRYIDNTAVFTLMMDGTMVE